MAVDQPGSKFVFLLIKAFLVAHKASAYNKRDPDLIPGSGRSSGEGN